MSMEVLQGAAEGSAEVGIVTVIAAQGSVPRHPGSRMLVRRTGQIVGTVGGGRGEAMAIEAALRGIQERRSRILTVEMRGMEAEGPDMVCGGMATLLVEYLPDSEPYRAALDSLASGRRIVLLKKLEGMAEGAAGTVSVAVLEESGPPPGGFPFDQEILANCMATGKPAFSAEAGLFYDPHMPREKLLVLGGGHVGHALAVMAAGLDFDVTVVDDRPDFTAAGRFPSPIRAVCAGYSDAIAAFPFDSATYAVIVTRGHLFDLECIRGILRMNYRYAGFIGSARKTRLLRDQAARDGFDAARIDALHAPIGLPIGAETPAEIAVSILGEIIAVRRNARRDGAPVPGRSTGQTGAR